MAFLTSGPARDIAAALAAGGFALVAALLIIALLGRWVRGGPSGFLATGDGAAGGSGMGNAVFLFEGEELVDATAPARRLLRGVDRRASDLGAVLRLLGQRFGTDLAPRLRALTAPARLRLADPAGGRLEAEATAAGLRLTLDLAPGSDLGGDGEGGEGLDRLRLESALDELATLRALAEDAPQLIWSVDATGSLTWANRAYLAMSDIASPGPPATDPPPPIAAQAVDSGEASIEAASSEATGPGDVGVASLAPAGADSDDAPSRRPYPFTRPTADRVDAPEDAPGDAPPDPAPPDAAGLDPAAGSAEDGAAWPTTALFEAPADLAEGQSETRRLALTLPGGGGRRWFEVTSVRRRGGHVRFAADADGLVRAEAARQEFVQTLTKTFAHLSVGLAIFDRQRRLVLFNPAFVDLTRLPVPFLSTRPPVQAVLDRLRDAKILPEPRNYATWRDEVAALEAAAAGGHYCETWSLPEGRTWRVTGRPHPDGALAFLFEDVTDEIALTRRFRGELHAAQAALDGLDDAVATFSAGGALGLSNVAYATLWGAPVADPGLDGELLRWEQRCAPSAAWRRLREGVESGRAAVEAEVRLAGGAPLRCRVAHMAGGGTLVTFRPSRPGDAVAATSDEAGAASASGPAVGAAAADAMAGLHLERPDADCPAPSWGIATPSPRATYRPSAAPENVGAPLLIDTGGAGDDPAEAADDDVGFASRRATRQDGDRASSLTEIRARFGVRA